MSAFNYSRNTHSEVDNEHFLLQVYVDKGEQVLHFPLLNVLYSNSQNTMFLIAHVTSIRYSKPQIPASIMNEFLSVGTIVYVTKKKT